MKKDNLNPHLMIGDEITVVHVDKSYGTMNTAERFKDYVVTGIKHRQRWIIKTEEGEEEFRNLPLIKDVDYWRVVNPLTEHMLPNDGDKSDLDLERFGNILVRAYFTYGGGWGQTPKRFVVYMTPSGVVKGVSLNQGMTS